MLVYSIVPEEKQLAWTMFSLTVHNFFAAWDTYLFTPQEISSDLSYLRWLDVYGQSSQAFQVQACEEVMIYLAEDFGIISDSWYHVYLGTDVNT